MQGEPQGGTPSRRPLDPAESARAAKRWWDADAASYQQEHGASLDGFRWGPEGLTEDEAGLLGRDLPGRRILELGCGAAQCSQWLAARGATAIALDISAAMLSFASRPGPPLVQASADALPFAEQSFDIVFSAHGAVAFVSDLEALLHEVARVLVPRGRVVFAVTHPMRWAFIDDPGPEGLTAHLSYFDRRPYVEVDDSGDPLYVEHHRTLGDTVAALDASGFRVRALVEPEWSDDDTPTWGAWSQLRGELIPGTAIWVAQRED